MLGMSSKERVLRACELKTSDRVAITFDAEPEIYQMLYKHFGINNKQQLFDRLNIDTRMILPEGFENKSTDSRGL